MKKEPMPKPKVVNPWPMQKRRAYKHVIEWDLKTYPAMKAEIEAEIREIEDMASPEATILRDNIYLTPRNQKAKPRQEGDEPSYMHAKSSKVSFSDPTVEKAEQLRKYRMQILSGTEYKEMVRRINAIERVLERLEESSISDCRMRAELIKSKYFKQEETDQQIQGRLNICVKTYYNWITKTIYEIAKELGFVI